MGGEYEHELALATRATDKALSTGSRDDHAQAATAWRKAWHSATCAGLREEAFKALEIAARHDVPRKVGS